MELLFPQREFVRQSGGHPCGKQIVAPFGPYGHELFVKASKPLSIQLKHEFVQAIRIATLNGAVFLGRQDQIGSIAVGKNADLVVVKGDPAARVTDIENVETVFKDGVGYDTKKLLDSVKGHYGEY